MIKTYTIINKTDIKKLEKFGIDKLTQSEQKQYIYSKGFHDIQFFASFFLPHLVYNQFGFHQKEILEKARSPYDLNIIVPRGHGKTTTIVVDLLHSLLYKVYNDQIYVATAGLGKETIGKISLELQSNDLIKDVFGDLIPKLDNKTKEEYGAKKFKQTYLELLNGAKLETITPGQAIRGKRPQRIVVDDIDKEAPNPTAGKKMIQWFLGSLYGTLLPGGKVVVIGTIVGNLCLVKQLKDRNWDTIEYTAIVNGKPLWADMWSLKSLQERKEKIGTLMFNQEYMNIPINAEDTIIKEEHIKYFDYKKGMKFDLIYMGLDPAISEKEKADDFGITITGIIGKDRYVIKNVGLKGKQKSTTNRNKTILRLYEEFDITRIFIEDNGFQALIKESLVGKNIAVKGVTSIKDKVTRLLRWQGEFETGKIFINSDIDMTGDLVQQLLQFPDVPHDDLVDSMVLSFGPKRKKKKKIMVAGG